MSPIYCFNFTFFAISHIPPVCRQIRKYFKAYFLSFVLLRQCPLPLAPQRKRRMIINGKWQLQNQHQNEASHSGGNTKLARVLGAVHIRETSFIMSYRNDPWKHSLKLLFSVQKFPDLQRFDDFSTLYEAKAVFIQWKPYFRFWILIFSRG